MAGPIYLLITSVVLGVAVAGLVGTVLHPLVVYFVAWSFVFAVDATNPLGLPPVAGKAVVILAVGQAAVFLGALLFFASVRERASTRYTASGLPSSSAHAPDPASSPSLARLWTAVLVLGIIVFVGVRSFRSSIESAAGLPANALSSGQVRALSGGAAAHPGISIIGLTLAALLAACGVVIAERRRLVGWAIAAGAISATTISPQRTTTLTAVALVLALWLYRRAQRRTSTPHRSPYLVIVTSVGAIILGAVFFNAVGEKLGKNALITHEVHSSTVPTSLIPLTVYMTASPSALSTTLSDHIDPTAGNRLRSIWILPRVASVFDPSKRVPDTVGAFTNISFLFNTYTWQGDLFFDFGIPGVAIAGILMGAISSWAHALALRRRSVFSAWLAAVVSILTLLGIIEFAFLWVEMPLWAVAGLAAFGSSLSWQPGRFQGAVMTGRRQRLPSA